MASRLRSLVRDRRSNELATGVIILDVYRNDRWLSWPQEDSTILAYANFKEWLLAEAVPEQQKGDRLRRVASDLEHYGIEPGSELWELAERTGYSKLNVIRNVADTREDYISLMQRCADGELSFRDVQHLSAARGSRKLRRGGPPLPVGPRPSTEFETATYCVVQDNTTKAYYDEEGTLCADRENARRFPNLEAAHATHPISATILRITETVQRIVMATV
jgi:hypothetical protein